MSKNKDKIISCYEELVEIMERNLLPCFNGSDIDRIDELQEEINDLKENNNEEILL